MRALAQLEAWCREHAETVLASWGMAADEASTLRLAKAVDAEVQRAGSRRSPYRGRRILDWTP